MACQGCPLRRRLADLHEIPDDNVPPNTPFDKVPEDWVCPICGAAKDQFAPAD